MDEALSRLADAAGIEARYWDIAGRLHERSSETARHLLGALGISAATSGDIAASLVRLEGEVWDETLPPVAVVAEGQEIAVPLRMPPTRWVRWTLDLEGGGQVSGEAVMEDIAIEATSWRGDKPIFLRRLRLPVQPPGYHRLRIEADAASAASLVVAPPRCHLPPLDRRYWGIAAQLYALRSDNNLGIGDFTDLHALMNWAHARGAAAVGVNPLHALFLDAPEDASPYSPNSRLFLNPLYLDVTAISDFAESAEARALLSSLRTVRAGPIIDYSAVAAAKLAVLGCLHRHFQTAHGSQADARRKAFSKFVEKNSASLRHFAAFQMLSEQFGTHDWMRWPRSWQKPDASAPFSRDQAERVAFFQYLQWQCDLQLSGAVQRGNATGATLYNDLAVSVASASADHWANQDLFLRDVRVGAPPDPFNEAGQEWGVVPFNPRRLRATGYTHFTALLRSNMRYAGTLRIDHVMGWQRLFLIPAGAPASEGAYLRFPLEDLLAIAALESRRHRCVVIGEDLGTVPAGFRERMAAANILSCRILYFERQGECFLPPNELPERAAVSAATHDLATLRGYWTGEDIAAKARLGILKGEEEQKVRDERARDKRLLLLRLAEEGLIASPENPDDVPWTPLLTDAIHAYLARSPALLFMMQLDDLANEAYQTNLPGSTTEYPNWRRRLNRTLAEMMSDPVIAQTMARIAHERDNRI